MPPGIIRPATNADVAKLAGVNLRSWQAAYRGIMPDAGLAGLTVSEFEAVWAENLAAAGRTNLLCEVDGAVAGFVSFGATRDKDGSAAEAGDAIRVGEIIGLYLDPPYWGMGQGRMLCDEALSALSAAGFGEVTLWVLRDNARARRFYERAGFVLEPGAQMYVQRWDVELPHVRYRRGARNL